jgi:hypothetical protein
MPATLPVAGKKEKSSAPSNILSVHLVYEQLNLVRQIFLDGRKLVPNPNPTWLGYSTGKWDGNTLVVETRGFNGKSHRIRRTTDCPSG